MTEHSCIGFRSGLSTRLLVEIAGDLAPKAFCAIIKCMDNEAHR